MVHLISVLYGIKIMGFMDFFRGSKGKKCGHCKKESETLPYTKKFDGDIKHFCSKECSRGFRISRKKQAKKPPTTGRSMPW